VRRATIRDAVAGEAASRHMSDSREEEEVDMPERVEGISFTEKVTRRQLAEANSCCEPVAQAIAKLSGETW
jgi:hypothetical protein